MTAKPKRPRDEDEAQSQRFIELARELEAEGDLDLEKADEAFAKLADKVLPPKERP
jgi:hypothetical protein